VSFLLIADLTKIKGFCYHGEITKGNNMSTATLAPPRRKAPPARTPAFTPAFSQPRTHTKVSAFENPSPSGDPWFLVPENLAALDEAIREGEEDIRMGRGRPWDEIKKELGL
jgi:hypothetical protein